MPKFQVEVSAEVRLQAVLEIDAADREEADRIANERLEKDLDLRAGYHDGPEGKIEWRWDGTVEDSEIEFGGISEVSASAESEEAINGER